MSGRPLLHEIAEDESSLRYGSVRQHRNDEAEGGSDVLEDPSASASRPPVVQPKLPRIKTVRSVPLLSDNMDPTLLSAKSVRRASTSSRGKRSRHGPDEDLVALRRIAEESLEGQFESAIDSRFLAGSNLPMVEGMRQSLDGMYSESGRLSSSPSPAPTLLPAEHRQDSGSSDPIDNSPYPEVRASVPPTDNTTLSINTPRMWTLSLVFAVVGSATNLFFSLRYPSVTITPVLALLLVHPLGLLWDRILKRSSDPAEIFIDGTRQRSIPVHVNDDLNDNDSTNSETLPSPVDQHTSMKRRLRLWLAQGSWNRKEHACVYISSNVSFGFAFATDVIVEQTKFYRQEATIMYQILLILSTQIFGYAVAGITRRYLVRPSGMIWPGTLISTAMFSAMHQEENKPANGWQMSRWKFFTIIFGASLAFYFLPGLLMPALSYFNVVTWIAPSSVVLANLFGVRSGLGLFPMTFDWSQVAFIGSPLVVPFWAALNVVGGLVIIMWIVAPFLYYMNTAFSAYLPILSPSVFDNTGQPYNVTRILTSDFLFDQNAYHAYSPVFLPITYVLSYAMQFAAVAALLTHTACWHGKDMWRQWRRSLAEVHETKSSAYAYEAVATVDSDSVVASSPVKMSAAEVSSTASATSHSNLPASAANTSFQESSRRLLQPEVENLLTAEDVHNRLMRRYEDVPVWWYLATGCVMTAVGMFVVEYYPIHLPWHGLLLALAISTSLFIPVGIIMATSNQQSSLYLICQLIAGAVYPGRGIANMVFVTYGYITSTQGIKFSSDLKLGHYMKIPPRLLFNVQMVSTIVSALSQLAALNWILANVHGICTPDAVNGFSCPIARVHFNGSILWGVVGPERFFGAGALYRPLVWAFAIGAVSPIIVWRLARRGRSTASTAPSRASRILRRVNLPIIFGSISWIPPATGLNFSVWAIVCYVFNYVIRQRAEPWWRKYNMTLSAALDASVACGVVVVFFGFVYPGWMDGFRWWGTEVYKQGCDWKACAWLPLPDKGWFGPSEWP